ncbi:LamG-like jellyroll fold domain-containing protein [Bremerella sp. P1]|uniref:LamG-like jellyroll fold domain-containing protein n=1 Tax=Bremerella sp. P1 TaxID=3026424 RepID=UPI00236871FF|nr:LamG-like jellyroll fold domain-containing protein [Bremerella sp. P1]WDI40584.1 FecR domain-containing protein [Bremerella sp. P1]
MNEKYSEIESLLFDWEAGTISDADLVRLQTLLKEDPEARKFYVQWQMLTTALDLQPHAAQPSLPDNLPSRPLLQQAKPSSFSWASIAAFALAACVLLSVGLLWSFLAGGNGSTPIASNGGTEVKENTSQGIAILTRLVEPAWPEGQPSRQVGEALTSGRFQLDEGLAQIEFFCGATIVLEGPADIELESSTQALVRQGKIRAIVPPAARGFSLDTDKMKVVDLGTEFGMAVSTDAVEVQVFDGEVELQPLSKDVRRITTGQGVSVGKTGDLTDSATQPEAFIGIPELESLSLQQNKQRYAQWKNWSDSIRSDPRLVTYYAFDQLTDWQRRLTCEVMPTNRDLDGAIIGAKVVEGRWPEKSSLEFKQPADRVRVNIPGQFKSLTFSCWTRIDSLDRMYNSLFLTDSYDKGEPHWQILDSGQLYFSVRPVDRVNKDGPRDFKALSPSFWNPTLQGKWIHLAVTCDWDSRTIIHYLNGKELSRHIVPVEQMPASAQIGTASIGNWELPTLPDAEFAVRNLNGRIDEFMIFSSALTSDEIQDIYDHGKP